MAKQFPTDYQQLPTPDWHTKILVADGKDNDKLKRGAWQDFKGEDAPNVLVQYSSDNSNWHDTPTQ